MLHIEKNYYSSSTICKKSQVAIFKFTPTGRSQKRIIKKKHPVYQRAGRKRINNVAQ